VLALPCLSSMELSVLFLAVPSFSADLEPSTTQLLWIINKPRTGPIDHGRPRTENVGAGVDPGHQHSCRR
jgi:hypothetical protein